MPYKATVIPIMIASPGDVYQEREIARDVIHTWSYIHSMQTGVVLSPVGWETHSSPEQGARAQELINNRVLKECDLLIGIFWTRIGSPTGDSISGTAGEIEKHISAGKPAMLYFSNQPVALGSVDMTQYERLKKFRELCKDTGLIESFENSSDFREKFSRQLQICLRDNQYLKDIIDTSSDTDSSVFLRDVTAKPGSDLSAEAKVLLKEAAQANGGTILKIAVIGGRFIQTNGKTFGGERGRESAKWEYALDQLVEANYVVARGYKGEVFEVTHSGYELADKLPDSA